MLKRTLLGAAAGFLLGFLLCALSPLVLAQAPSCYDTIDEPSDLDCSALSQAEFTAIGQQFESISKASIVITNILGYVKMVPGDTARAYAVVERLTKALDLHVQGLLWLLDMNGGQSTGNERSFLLNARALVVARGMNELTTTLYDATQAALDPLIAECLECPGIKSARDNLAKARQLYGTLDRGLAYTEPRIRWNLAFPVATREQSSWVAPHGDYRRYGEEMNGLFDVLLRLLNEHYSLVRDYPDLTAFKKWADTSINHTTSLGYAIRMLALAVGVEFPYDRAAIDFQVDRDSTNRGRQFFRGVMAMEIGINTDHRPPWEGDVFGRTDQVRGLPYQWNNAQNHLTLMQDTYASTPDIVARVSTMLQRIGVGWESSDNGTHNVIGLRYNMTFPMGPDEGHGGAPPEPEPEPEPSA